MNYQFKPNLNISIPLSPKFQQIPSGILKTMKNRDDANYFPNFNEKNLSIGFPTPMGGYYEPQISPVGLNNIIMYPPLSTKNIYNVDFGNDNYFLRKNIYNPMLTPNTPKREINLQNKIVIQNNNNINGDEINSNNLQEKFKKPTINLDIIENNDNNSHIQIFHFFLKIWEEA